MTSKQKSYKLALVSIAMVLMLVSTAGATRFGEVILKTDSCTGMVDFLKFPVCGCEDNSGCGSFMDVFRHCLPCHENCTKERQQVDE
jgi:hypothetical protein